MQKILTLFAFALMSFAANAQICPNDNHPHIIDLGLPSGTKWACCNVGATTPEAYGGYYAWCETEEKSTYNWSNYKYWTDNNGDGSVDENEVTNLGSDIAGTQYDVAHVKWGGSWVMPSLDQIKELVYNCTYSWTTMNGVQGCKFTGPNGSSIFLPAEGYRWNDGLINNGNYGYYWSSTRHPSYSGRAFDLYFTSNSTGWRYNYRLYDGRSVRPVSR